MADSFGSGKLLKKPELKRPESPAQKKLFDDAAPAAAEPAAASPAAAAPAPAASVASSGK
jgi:hypothetical protein